MGANRQEETKRNRFVKIAEGRVNSILETLHRLEKCSNRGNYEYSEEDVRKIFNALEGEVKRVKASFNQNARGEKTKFKLEG